MGAELLALYPGWIAAFVLFRLFDIWKPGPVGWADRRGDALGVMLDDVIAGVMAAIGVALLALNPYTLGYTRLLHIAGPLALLMTLAGVSLSLIAGSHEPLSSTATSL